MRGLSISQEEKMGISAMRQVVRNPFKFCSFLDKIRTMSPLKAPQCLPFELTVPLNSKTAPFYGRRFRNRVWKSG